ncbi:DNA/RNA nuclease SfsA [Lacibacterium aquatile]|uniref:Sugar fermentation stimulation protein homolog n=1 Tax=Lacibacterium aquatile TaxID=1168082 RepID=A0ABW5DVG8_9PROT
MIFDTDLVEATLVRRYKRFLADVVLPDGSEVTAHCPNPGAMIGLCAPGSKVYLLPGKGKLPWSWELVERPEGLIGINTNRPNTLVAEALAADAIPELSGYDVIRREVPYGVNSRIDFLLEGSGRPPAYVEVKNVHLVREPDMAEFPDCVTARGAKHLVELSAMVAAGGRAVMLYVVQLDFCRNFALAGDYDPAYLRAFRAAKDAGVEAYAYDCQVDKKGLRLMRPMRILDR